MHAFPVTAILLMPRATMRLAPIPPVTRLVVKQYLPVMILLILQSYGLLLLLTLDKLHRGVFGDLAWVERRPLASGAEAFDDLRHGRSAAPKIVLEP